jgi:hypothetical protein
MKSLEAQGAVRCISRKIEDVVVAAAIALTQRQAAATRECAKRRGLSC